MCNEKLVFIFLLITVTTCNELDVSNANYTQYALVTKYGAEVVFSCYDGYLSLGETTGTAICSDQGVWQYAPCAGKCNTKNINISFFV